jgi:GxxExxY protein
MKIDSELTGSIIGAAIEVHRELGPGLLESGYQACLIKELKEDGFEVKSEISRPVIYKAFQLDQGYRINILVEDHVVVKLKTVERLSEVHTAQILTYMKLGHYPLGLLINFNVKLLKNGIKRFVL